MEGASTCTYAAAKGTAKVNNGPVNSDRSVTQVREVSQSRDVRDMPTLEQRSKDRVGPEEAPG